MRPRSIERFAKLYPISIVLGLAINLLTWSDLQAFHAGTALRAFGAAAPVFGVFVGIAISTLLWYLIVQRRSNIARWVVVVLFAFGAIGLVWTVASGRLALDLSGLLGLVRLLVQAFAVAQLFLAESRPWFSKNK